MQIKRIVTYFIAAAMIFGLLPAVASAATAANEGNYYYTVSNGEATIVSTKSLYGPEVIPATLGGYPVAHIDDGAFMSQARMTSITIPDSVTSIGNAAFYLCQDLTSITIPGSVTSIGSYVFKYCSSMKVITFEGNAPSFGDNVFVDLTVTAYYNAGNATWTEDVMQDYGGNITWVPYGVEEESAVEEWNVSLEDALQVNFYLDAGIAETETITVTVGEKAYTAAISALAKDENGRPVVSVPVAAPQMKDEITVQVSDAEPAVYSVRQYCDTILADESKSQYHQLVKEMLNYGAMAQNYFGYNTESLANVGITGAGAAEVPETTPDMIISGETEDVAFYGASLVYRDKIAVRYYFTGDVSNATFTVDGTACTPVEKDGAYYIEVADILPQNLEQQITLMVQDNSGNTLTVTYGPMNYIVRMNQNGSKETKALIKALYNYHLAAKALCEEIV